MRRAVSKEPASITERWLGSESDSDGASQLWWLNLISKSLKLALMGLTPSSWKWGSDDFWGFSLRS